MIHATEPTTVLVCAKCGQPVTQHRATDGTIRFDHSTVRELQATLSDAIAAAARRFAEAGLA